MVDLPPVGVDLLAQIALPAGEGHEHDRQLRSAQDRAVSPARTPRSAGVGVHLRTKRHLHREVGHTGAWRKGSIGDITGALL